MGCLRKVWARLGFGFFREAWGFMLLGMGLGTQGWVKDCRHLFGGVTGPASATVLVVGSIG